MKLTPKQTVFCSYAFTGEEPATVGKRMRLVVDTFNELGLVARCNLDDPRIDQFTGPKQFIDHALDELRACDVVFVVMASERRSEGMLIEIGAAYAARKPIILAQHIDTVGKTYVDKLAAQTLQWDTSEDLVALIHSLV